MVEPEEFIYALRQTDPHIEIIYLNGGCYQFHLLLKAMYGGEPYIDKFYMNHVITKIGDKFYDITGVVDFTGYRQMSSEEKEMASKWSFRRTRLLQIDECDQCDSPLVYDTKEDRIRSI